MFSDYIPVISHWGLVSNHSHWICTWERMNTWFRPFPTPALNDILMKVCRRFYPYYSGVTWAPWRLKSPSTHTGPVMWRAFSIRDVIISIPFPDITCWWRFCSWECGAHATSDGHQPASYEFSSGSYGNYTRRDTQLGAPHQFHSPNAI